MRKILVIRKADAFSQMLTENDFEVLNLPLIETRALDDLCEFETKLETIEIYDGIFLTSRHAARILTEKLREKDLNFGGKIYVFGKRGFDVLKTGNFDSVFFDDANTAHEMLEKISAENLTGKRFLFVRGEKSLRVVPEFLAQISTVDEAVVYETKNIVVEKDWINFVREEFESGEIATVCFFSPSAAESFIEQFGAEILHQTRIATIGKTTAEFFERRNLTVDFVSLKATAEDFAVGLTDYLRKEN